MLLLSTSTAAWLHPCSQIICAKTSMWSIMINEAIPIIPRVQLWWLCSAGASTHSFSCKLTLPLKSEQNQKNKEAKYWGIAHNSFWVWATVCQVATVSYVTNSFITTHSVGAVSGLLTVINWKPAFGYKTRAKKHFLSDTDTLSALDKIWQSSPTIQTAPRTRRTYREQWEHSWTKWLNASWLSSFTVPNELK